MLALNCLQQSKLLCYLKISSKRFGVASQDSCPQLEKHCLLCRYLEHPVAFANLDRNKDESLRSEEVAQVLNAQQFAAADADRDGKLSRTEFLNRVMADFKSADRSGDGSLQ